MTRTRALLTFVAGPVVVFAAAGLAFAAGAGRSDATPSRGTSGEEPNARVFHVEVDGRRVACVLVDPPKAAIAVTCDWAGAG